MLNANVSRQLAVLAPHLKNSHVTGLGVLIHADTILCTEMAIYLTPMVVHVKTR